MSLILSQWEGVAGKDPPPDCCDKATVCRCRGENPPGRTALNQCVLIMLLPLVVVDNTVHIQCPLLQPEAMSLYIHRYETYRTHLSFPFFRVLQYTALVARPTAVDSRRSGCLTSSIRFSSLVNSHTGTLIHEHIYQNEPPNLQAIFPAHLMSSAAKIAYQKLLLPFRLSIKPSVPFTSSIAFSQSPPIPLRSYHLPHNP